MQRRGTPPHAHLYAAFAALALLAGGPAAQALDAIELEVRELTVAGVQVAGARVRLDVLDDTHTRLRVSARSVPLPQPGGVLSDLALVCERPVIAEPRFACDAGTLSARGGPLGGLAMKIAAAFDVDTGVASVRGSGQQIAGSQLSFEGELGARGWKLAARTGRTTLAALLKFAAPWFTLPKDLNGDGKVTLEAALADSGSGLVGDAAATLETVDFTNEASTLVADKLGATLRVGVRSAGGAGTALTASIAGAQGQALLGPVLFDLAANPLSLETRGALADRVLTIDALQLHQKDLLDLTGSGRVSLAGATPLVSGDFTFSNFRLKAGYPSYMQITLAASMLGDLEAGGVVNGTVSVVDNGIRLLHVLPLDVDLRDRKGRLHLSKMRGNVYWTPPGVDARPSRIGWESGGMFGLSGGAAGLEFIVQGANFALLRPAKLPVFDGGIAIENFAMGNLGAKDMQVAFSGAIEPISLPLLCRAFGWPEFSGTLAARIPGVRLEDDVLTFDGNVESDVFGGHIVGSDIRLQDPLGNFPRLYADVRARNLDLELVTRTFEVGTITGRLEADILGLELFDWSPVAFNARLATPRGDESRHKISAKAVSSLSNVGGGGGGVVQALQSGVLRFFDEYSYDKLGITCQLRDDVCIMSGVEPAPGGYYIVKGSGLPRIDIVGNAGRVSWSQLLSSIPKDFGSATVQ
jgi:hypothetical protein